VLAHGHQTFTTPAKSSSASAPTPTQAKIRNLKSEIRNGFKGPSDVLDHATSEIASGSKLGLDATKKLPGEGFKRPWPPLIKMSDEVRRKIDALFKTNP
jgi:hypothetical protein